MNTKTAAEIIAAATGGRESWDSEALRECAEHAISGTPAHKIPGRPADSEEFIAFASAVAEIQS